MRIRNCLRMVCLGVVLAASAHAAGAEAPAKRIRVGIIGLDTSHAVEFTKQLNDPKATGELAGLTVVAAYPGGSPDVSDSWSRVERFTDEVRGMGVEIVDSIDELLKRVDVVLLESVDGRTHLAQARPVIAAGKPLFIDKPMAASLANAMRIFHLAKEKNVPVFSASSLRFNEDYQAVRNGKAGLGQVRICTAWSPMHLEPHHPDFFWYAIHGVESLFTIMGPGCETVTRVGPEKVAGAWKDGRQGVFVATDGYGALVEGEKKNRQIGKFDGYAPLLAELVKFFKTGKPPVSADETLEILAFMEAADESKLQGGAPVSIESVMKKAQQQVDKDGP
jgi:hypothetical protein